MKRPRSASGKLPAPPPRRRGRPPNTARERQILAAAAQLFMQQGFHATRMEQIARAVGISKLTLYSRFADKHALFSAVIAAKCQEYVPDRMFSGLDAMSAEQSLREIAGRLMRLLTSPAAIGMERMLMGLPPPERATLTRLFYAAGPHRVKSLIHEHLLALHRRRALHVPDAWFATHVFTSLVKGSEPVMRAQMGIRPLPSAGEKQHVAQRVVMFFMAALRPAREKKARR